MWENLQDSHHTLLKAAITIPLSQPRTPADITTRVVRIGIHLQVVNSSIVIPIPTPSTPLNSCNCPSSQWNPTSYERRRPSAAATALDSPSPSALGLSLQDSSSTASLSLSCFPGKFVPHPIVDFPHTVIPSSHLEFRHVTQQRFSPMFAEGTQTLHSQCPIWMGKDLAWWLRALRCSWSPWTRSSCWNRVWRVALVHLQLSLAAPQYGRLRERAVTAGRIDDSGVTAHCGGWPLVQRIYAKNSRLCRIGAAMRHHETKSVWEVEGVEDVILKVKVLEADSPAREESRLSASTRTLDRTKWESEGEDEPGKIPNQTLLLFWRNGVRDCYAISKAVQVCLELLVMKPWSWICCTCYAEMPLVATDTRIRRLWLPRTEVTGRSVCAQVPTMTSGRLSCVLAERRRLNQENIDDDDRPGVRAFVYLEKLDLVGKVFDQVDLFDRDLPQMRRIKVARRLCEEGSRLVVTLVLDAIFLDRFTVRCSDGGFHTVNAGDAVEAGPLPDGELSRESGGLAKKLSMSSLPWSQFEMLDVGPGQLHSVRSPVMAASSAMRAFALVPAQARIDTEIGCLGGRNALLRERLNQLLLHSIPTCSVAGILWGRMLNGLLRTSSACPDEPSPMLGSGAELDMVCDWHRDRLSNDMTIMEWAEALESHGGASHRLIRRSRVRPARRECLFSTQLAKESRTTLPGRGKGCIKEIARSRYRTKCGKNLSWTDEVNAEAEKDTFANIERGTMLRNKAVIGVWYGPCEQTIKALSLSRLPLSGIAVPSVAPAFTAVPYTYLVPESGSQSLKNTRAQAPHRRSFADSQTHDRTTNLVMSARSAECRASARLVCNDHGPDNSRCLFGNHKKEPHSVCGKKPQDERLFGQWNSIRYNDHPANDTFRWHMLSSFLRTRHIPAPS
ncbi:uncharacterized protein MYCFIDRAFT_172865 [Pseudocercospora fijiensis CIRAD86]|uniref:Uncharacterized protein n=1 Tax=Pseudocercospora fijiensis (strain CIRAD86) TaxID=383855 RepID=M3B344_PSEFD|nr:uncharacterized protein MYCFIDRAFT_172865 [Pseudocercospora fijiensis CIRAD86]EME83787.1 hypothetical protein MYCFIDRAFT_172865 [Pseudocercospora fijiensis CIRAD86]